MVDESSLSLMDPLDDISISTNSSFSYEQSTRIDHETIHFEESVGAIHKTYLKVKVGAQVNLSLVEFRYEVGKSTLGVFPFRGVWFSKVQSLIPLDADTVTELLEAEVALVIAKIV